MSVENNKQKPCSSFFRELQHLELGDEGKSDEKTEIAASQFSVDTDVQESKVGQCSAKRMSPRLSCEWGSAELESYSRHLVHRDQTSMLAIATGRGKTAEEFPKH